MGPARSRPGGWPSRSPCRLTTRRPGRRPGKSGAIAGAERSSDGLFRRSIRRWPKGFAIVSRAAWATPMRRWFRSAADVAVRHELDRARDGRRGSCARRGRGDRPCTSRAGRDWSSRAGRPSRSSESRSRESGKAAQSRRALRVDGPSPAQSDCAVAAGRAASGAASLGSVDASGRRSGRLLGHGRRRARAPALDKRPTWAVIRG